MLFNFLFLFCSLSLSLSHEKQFVETQFTRVQSLFVFRRGGTRAGGLLCGFCGLRCRSGLFLGLLFGGLLLGRCCGLLSLWGSLGSSGRRLPLHLLLLLLCGGGGGGAVLGWLPLSGAGGGGGSGLAGRRLLFHRLSALLGLLKVELEVEGLLEGELLLLLLGGLLGGSGVRLGRLSVSGGRGLDGVAAGCGFLGGLGRAVGGGRFPVSLRGDLAVGLDVSILLRDEVKNGIDLIDGFSVIV